MTTTPQDAPRKALTRPQYRFGFFFPFTAAEKTYGIVVGLSVLTIFIARFLQDGPPVAFTFLVSAALGFFFHWRKMPVIGVVVLAYFLFAPLMFPYSTPYQFIFRQNHFEPMTLVLTAAVVIYLNAQYRLYGLTDRAMPNEKIDDDKKAKDSFLRDVLVIPTNEIVVLVIAAIGMVLCAEVIYLLVNEFYFEPAREHFPIRWAGKISDETSGLPGSVVPWGSRFILTVSFFAIMAIMARFVFWYWRISGYTREEGTAAIADDAWASNHPDRRRIELWRAWAKNRRKAK